MMPPRTPTDQSRDFSNYVATSPTIASSHYTNASHSSEAGIMRETRYTPPSTGRSHSQSYSLSSHRTNVSRSTRTDNRAAQRVVRTLPSWIDSYEEGDETHNHSLANARSITAPPRAQPAQHLFQPAAQNGARRSTDGWIDEDEEKLKERPPERGIFGGKKEPRRGTKWDHARDREPVIMGSGPEPISSAWRTFLKASMYGPASQEDVEKVDQNYLENLTPGYRQPWRGDIENGEGDNTFAMLLHSHKRRKKWYQQIQHTMLMHPLVPLVFRLIILITSLSALSLAGSIFHLSHSRGNQFPEEPSTIMAIVVDVIAVPYLCYVTWDEYTGKPLGLRSPKAKIRLVLLDLFFVIFEAANLALAFQALTNPMGSCRDGVNGTSPTVCAREKGLCAVLMIAILAWSLTFSVSIFRLVERVGGREDDD